MWHGGERLYRIGCEQGHLGGLGVRGKSKENTVRNSIIWVLTLLYISCIRGKTFVTHRPSTVNDALLIYVILATIETQTLIYKKKNSDESMHSIHR